MSQDDGAIIYKNYGCDRTTRVQFTQIQTGTLDAKARSGPILNLRVKIGQIRLLRLAIAVETARGTSALTPPRPRSGLKSISAFTSPGSAYSLAQSATMSAIKRSVDLLKAIIVRVPMIIKTLLLHGLRMSPTTGKQDLRTELTVAIVRSFLSPKHSILKTQKNSLRDPGIKGPMWVSKVTLPRPEIDVRDAVLRAIDDLKTGDETFDIPAIAAVEAEWTAHRSGVGKHTPQPDLSEDEKYRELRKETPSDMTILYLHGGAYM